MRSEPRRILMVTVSDGLERTGITAAAGAIRLAPIQTGMMAVEVSALGYGPGGEAVLIGPGTGTTDVAITLRKGTGSPDAWSMSEATRSRTPG
jgi:hypothetical protein